MMNQPQAFPQSTRGPVLLQVAGRWGLRGALEIVLALALVVVVVSSGPPRAWAVLVCLAVVPMLVFTRKMLILDPTMRVARGASLLRWFTNVQVSFDELRPWIHASHEVTNYRNRSTGVTRTSRLNRRLLHLTATSRAPFAHTTSEFSGFDRFVIIVQAFVGAPVDPAMLTAAFAAERIRVIARAVVTSLLAAMLLFFTLVAAYDSGAIAAVLGLVAVPFVLLSIDRWMMVGDAAILRERPATPPSRLPIFAGHGAAFGLTLVAFPILVLVHSMRGDARSAAYREQREQGAASSAKDLADHPAKGDVAPIVPRPSQVNTLLDASNVDRRLSGKGFRTTDKAVDGSSPYQWRIDARTGGPNGGTIEVSLRRNNLKTTGKLVGGVWVAVYAAAGETDVVASDQARNAVLAYVASRGTDDATLKAALVSVGVANVTARGGRAWGWLGPKRQELSVEAIPMEERSEMRARSCVPSTSKELVCAELNRTIYRKTDPNFAGYALAVATGSAP